MLHVFFSLTLLQNHKHYANLNFRMTFLNLSRSRNQRCFSSSLDPPPFFNSATNQTATPNQQAFRISALVSLKCFNHSASKRKISLVATCQSGARREGGIFGRPINPSRNSFGKLQRKPVKKKRPSSFLRHLWQLWQPVFLMHFGQRAQPLKHPKVA